MSDEERVRQKWPDASASSGPRGTWYVWVIVGSGSTEATAWSDAAKRLEAQCTPQE